MVSSGTRHYKILKGRLALKNKTVKKRFLATVLTAALASTMFYGCGGEKAEDAQETSENQTQEAASEESDETALDSGKVELTIWAGDSYDDCLFEMVESFKKEYAGQADFEINVMESSDADTRNAVLNDIYNAGDIFSMPDDQLYSLIAGGGLSPVENQAAIKSANLAEAVEAASYNDTLYAYPYSADNGYFLYYNKEYLTADDVKTMDGLLAAAETAGKQVSMEFNSGWYLYSFFGNTGLEFGINDDSITNHCNWNSTEGSIKGVDIAEALLDITSSPAFIAQPDGNFVEGIQSGDIIAGVSGVWNASAVQEAWGDDYGAVKLPTYTCNGQQVQMASFTGYKMYGVNAYSKHLGWAHKLAEWLTNEQNQTLRFQARSTGPSNINAAASDEVAKAPAIAAIIDQSQYGVLQRVGNSYWNACTNFADIIAAGNPDNLDLQELMDTLVSGITASAVQ